MPGLCPHGHPMFLRGDLPTPPELGLLHSPSPAPSDRGVVSARSYSPSSFHYIKLERLSNSGK